MASAGFPFYIFITSLLVVFISPSQSSSRIDVVEVPPENRYNHNVNVSLYYETLCPGCADFVVNDLTDILFNKSLDTIINLRMVPWGNARISEPRKKFVCQHGPDECYFNTIHACAIKAYSPFSAMQPFGFIACMEEEALKQEPGPDKEKVWRSCCESLQLDPKPIEDCYNSGDGRKLELEYADETELLNPPKTYVPWILVNDEHIDDYPNLLVYVCKAYKGDHVPASCKSIHSKTNTSLKKSKHPACHAIGARVQSEAAPRVLSEAPPRVLSEAPPHKGTGGWRNTRNEQP